MVTYDNKVRYFDLDSLKPGEGVVRFWDGHDEFMEHWQHTSNGMTFYTSSGKYVYNNDSKMFYRMVWETTGFSITGRPDYMESTVEANHVIESIWFKEKENSDD